MLQLGIKSLRKNLNVSICKFAGNHNVGNKKFSVGLKAVAKIAVKTRTNSTKLHHQSQYKRNAQWELAVTVFKHLTRDNKDELKTGIQVDLGFILSNWNSYFI